MRDGIRFIGPFGETYELVDLWRGHGSPEGGVPVDAASASLVAMQSETLRDELARSSLADDGAFDVDDELAAIVGELDHGEVGRFALFRIEVQRPAVTNVAPEAPLLSDLAQKPPPSQPAAPDVQFEVRVVDELGEPVAGVELTWTQSGDTGSATTDGSGVARFTRPPGPSFASVRFTDLDALRDTMKPKWDATGRSPGTTPIVASDDVTVVFLRDDLDGRTFPLVAKQSHDISVQPYVLLARLFGLSFETSKCFLLPEAIPSLRAMRRIYDANPDTTLLVVGHTDTAGEPSYNDPLSLERAAAMAGYLKDDVDAWLAHYESGKPAEKRWGSHEDGLMMLALVGDPSEPGVSPTLAFQRFWNAEVEAGNQEGDALEEDGAMGPNTRRALVTAYQKQDNTTLPEDVELEQHGCGETFPLDDTGTEVDAAPVDGKDDRTDRRVELFFFDKKLGVQPPPPGDNSKPGAQQYPEWRARARVVSDFAAGVQAPIFDWDDALDAGMPKDLELVLRDDETEMTIAWKAGARSGKRRRFVFGDLSGDLPCTLVAKTGGEEIVLLDQQTITSEELPIVWTAWLEDLVAIPGPANDSTTVGDTLKELLPEPPRSVFA
ncbi:MAG TPA: hypothetical protein VG755_12350 [Nannocystaceae bacterium]|nr:hypothetical protein [Nannocystaceae bacterium]